MQQSFFSRGSRNCCATRPRTCSEVFVGATDNLVEGENENVGRPRDMGRKVALFSVRPFIFRGLARYVICGAIASIRHQASQGYEHDGRGHIAGRIVGEWSRVGALNYSVSHAALAQIVRRNFHFAHDRT